MRQLFAGLLILAAAGCSKANEQIECPAPESGQAAGTLRESPDQIKAAGDQLGQGSENEIAEAAARIRARHAGAARSEVINYLVTAYCPRINGQSSLDKSAKQQALQSFSARAEKIVKAGS